MYSFYKELEDEKISLAYFGIFTDNITAKLIDLSESYISRQDKLKKLTRKTSFLIAESFQNIIRHEIVNKEKVPDTQYNKDFFQISVLDDRIVISSANVIDNKEIKSLDKYIDNINSLNNSELKAFQLEMLENSEMTKKGGAGLGLLEMVRKSGLPLKKKFISLSESFSLVILSLEVIIAKDEDTHKVHVQNIENLYKRLVEKNIVMIYKGDFSSSSNSNIIEMLNNNFIDNGRISPKRLKNIVAVIEVMQNVSKHGKEINGYKEGLFALSSINGELHIAWSNFIIKEEFEKMESMLKTLKACSLEQLDKLYKNKIVNSYLSNQDGTGLGLLEIARFSKKTFSYNFITTDNNEIFYTINVKIV